MGVEKKEKESSDLQEGTRFFFFFFCFPPPTLPSE